MSMALEAVAINYLSHTVWAWIAFLTAALSLWKIKSSSTHSPSPPPLPPHHDHRHLSAPSSPQTSAEPADPDQRELPSTTTTFFTLENRRSGKFRVYYGEEDDKEDPIGSNELRTRTTGHNIGNPERLINDGWDALLKLKTAELGWYRYQDLTMLDGSVVQLWNQFNHHVLIDY